MSAWIESHQTLGRHYKTGRLARLLGISRVTAVGHLQFFWWWAIDYAQDGEITPFDSGEIAEACEWEGDPEVFIHALISSKFVDDENGKRTIHDHDEYAGKLIDNRKRNAEKQKRWRNKRNGVTLPLRVTDDESNVTVTLPLRNRATEQNTTQQNTTEQKALGVAPAAREKKAGSNIPPTAEEVAAYFAAKSTKSEGRKFFLHYEANGWMVGKNRMKNWMASASGWITRGPGFTNGSNVPISVEPPKESDALRLARERGSVI